MLWTIIKAVLLVTGLLIVMATIDLLWRRTFGCPNSRQVGGCGKGCLCTRRLDGDSNGL